MPGYVSVRAISHSDVEKEKRKHQAVAEGEKGSRAVPLALLRQQLHLSTPPVVDITN